VFMVFPLITCDYNMSMTVFKIIVTTENLLIASFSGNLSAWSLSKETELFSIIDPIRQDEFGFRNREGD
jgi:hypothetical protein